MHHRSATERQSVPEGMDVETVPASVWAVFTITSSTGSKEAEEAYARIFTEWFPASEYLRNEAAPTLEVYGPGNADSPEYRWEIWIPVFKR